MSAPRPGPQPGSPGLAECAPATGELLSLAAFLDPAHPIPVSALRRGAAALPAPLAAMLGDEAARERCFDDLLARGWGGVAGDDLILRRARVEEARARLEPGGERGWAVAAAAALERAFPHDPCPEPVRAEAGRLLPHAVAAASHALALGVGLAPVAQLFHLAGRYTLEVRGDAVEARSLLERGVLARERAHGGEDARVAFDLGYLNAALLHLGEWAAMAANAVRAARILEAQYGPRDRTAITHVNNAALLLARAGDSGTAREWFARALALAQPVFGGAHPFCASILSNLGDQLQVDGDLAGARECFGRALAIDQVAHGPGHDSVARDHLRLGEVLVEAGDHASARGHLERALAWLVLAHGEQDPRALRASALLARLEAAPPA
jgi:tetratricopeptide (TPR) repeat protein